MSEQKHTIMVGSTPCRFTETEIREAQERAQRAIGTYNRLAGKIGAILDAEESRVDAVGALYALATLAQKELGDRHVDAALSCSVVCEALGIDDPILGLTEFAEQAALADDGIEKVPTSEGGSA